MSTNEQEWTVIDTDGTEYGSDWPTIVHMAENGLHRRTTAIRPPGSMSWVRAGDIPELRDAFAKGDLLILWRVQVNGQELSVVGVQGLYDWAKQGRFGPHDLVYSPHEKRWAPAEEVEKLRGAFGPRTKVCPFCKRSDLHVSATRCPHCGGDVGQYELMHSKVCFVATCVYQHPDHPHIEVLRKWRDGPLSCNYVGRVLVRAYYSIAPSL